MGQERKIVINGGSDNARELESGDRYAHVAQTLWAEKDTGTTAGLSAETIYLYTLPANVLSANDSSISMVFNGVFAGNANPKYIRVRFNNTVINIDGEYNGNIDPWQVQVQVMRTSSSAVECTGLVLINGETPFIKSTDISSLNLVSNEYDIELELETPDGAGDVTVNNGRIVYYPAAP